MSKEREELFAVFAEAKDYDKPLILTNLTFARLIDDILVPYDERKKPFFIDGAPINHEKIRKLKILRQKSYFPHLFHELNRGMRKGDKARQKIFGDQYYTRLEAVLREGCEDVTSQVIKAFDTKIKPSLRDYLPKREELIKAAYIIFFEGIKQLSGN